ncbi:DNA primase [Pullulanibacillus pueri]|uniref:DNA primase n=1 Tax=Pullulanibacillus pueri TaxID=1437324 RepID=A0A8J3EN44_9BACL|nr:DNA primase [Pullulanibacillus pueri]MBM7683033.1 DNA primase [Pullulanibacillus pueri]GGH85007.1 DNA primase [Pullulanibacillus pueri]
MRIDEETIEKVRKSLDIVEVVGEYVQLKRQGRDNTGLCPFHSERTPSFHVSQDKQLYHCFGCKAGGDIFTFIQEIEGIDFPEAIALLADKAGIVLPNMDYNQQNPLKNDNTKTLYHGMELLSKFYQYLLLDSRYGRAAQSYLKERHFDPETIKTFQIGYAVDSWETAAKFLIKRKFSPEQFAEIGLLLKREFDGKFYDRFRHRVMFPIHDQRGRTVAFAGRVLDNQKPKYLNSPESQVFHKGKILYGYHLARATIKQLSEVILFEGYVDVIKAHQAGIKNAVASMGTSLTSEQVSLLSRNTENIIICYDSDQAGTEAAFRAAEMLKSFNGSIKIARMPQGMDPDDYIDRYGGEHFRNNVLGASLTIMAFKMQYLRYGKNLNDEGERLRYIERVLHEIAKLKKAVERDHYLRQLSDEFSISLDALKQQQYQIYRNEKQQHDSHNQTKPNTINSRLLPKNRTLFPAYQMAERRLLAHMMHDADVAEQVQERLGGAFNSDIHQALAAYLYGFYSEGRSADVSTFIHTIKDRELKSAATEIAMMSVNTDVSPQEIDDYIDQVHKHAKKVEIENKEKEKKDAERNQDFDKAAHILAEIISMKKQLENR